MLVEASIWKWLDAPQGPDMPFGSPLLIFLDTIRLLTVLASGFILVRCFRYLFVFPEPHQRARFVALGLIVLSVAGTEFEHIGDFAHYRLALNFLGSLVAIWGLKPVLPFAKQRPTEPDEPDKPDESV